MRRPTRRSTFRGTSNEPQYGVGVGAGNLGGGTAPDFVVLSADTLHIYVDGLPTIDKTYASSGEPIPVRSGFALLDDAERANRAVIVGAAAGERHADRGGDAGHSGIGHVSLFTSTPSVTRSPARWTLTATEAFRPSDDGGRPRSGPDHKPDHLLIGAPPTHAYLYSLPLTARQPAVTVPALMCRRSVRRGGRGVRHRRRPGRRGVYRQPRRHRQRRHEGRPVNVYTGATLAPLAPTFPNPLAEHDPGTGHGYGSGIAGLIFCPGAVSSPDGGAARLMAAWLRARRLPLVGSLSKVFTYFTLKKPDPRVK